MKNEDNNLLEIKTQLTSIHQDIKRIMEKSNQQYIDFIASNLRKDYLNAITGYVNNDIETGLEESMIEKCEMRTTCKKTFTEFLQKNTSLIRNENVTEETIQNNKSELEEIKETAPFKKCNTCFTEVSNLFQKQLNLMNSLRIYSTNEDKKKDASLISEEFLVKDVFEPLSNKQRIQILKSMLSETKTFSALSELTGLRGGNLLFHIQKLLDTNIILQRHERGDYMITEKGYKLLMLITEIQKTLE